MHLFKVWVVSFGLSVSPLVNAADQAKKLATVEINLDDKVEAKDVAGIRTLFVSVYDNDSKMRMPWGVMKVDLKADAKGSLFKGDLTSANIKPMMGVQGPIPTSIRIKVRLDKDGSAGPDQPGDLVGQVESLKVGDKTKIEVNKLIK